MRISVAMATYNGERFLEAQLRSILSQLDRLDEMVIVDDGSSDRTRHIIAGFGDPRIRLLTNDRNEGVLRSFERALRATTGEVVFLADQDDLWLPGKRDTLVEALRGDDRNTIALSDAQVIDAEGRIVAPSFMALRGGFRSGLLATLIKNRYLGCAMAVKRRLLDAALPIPADVPMHDIWLGAINRLVGTTVYIDRPLMQYRRHGANVSPSERAHLSRMLQWRWRLASNLIQRAVRLHLGVKTP